MKERVRRLAQKEAQEDAESLRLPSQVPKRMEDAPGGKQRCDPQRDEACDEPSSNRTRLGLLPR